LSLIANKAGEWWWNMKRESTNKVELKKNLRICRKNLWHEREIF
jgi:hypothetical protein